MQGPGPGKITCCDGGTRAIRNPSQGAINFGTPCIIEWQLNQSNTTDRTFSMVPMIRQHMTSCPSSCPIDCRPVTMETDHASSATSLRRTGLRFALRSARVGVWLSPPARTWPVDRLRTRAGNCRDAPVITSSSRRLSRYRGCPALFRRTLDVT